MGLNITIIKRNWVEHTDEDYTIVTVQQPSVCATSRKMNSSMNQDKPFNLHEESSLPALSRIFAPKVIEELANNGESPLLKRILREAGVLADKRILLSDVFNYSYKAIEKSYRNEYVYKNSIANKILLGRHSLNTATMLTEFRISESKADALILNGTSHVYEIKTELDSLDRLKKQISDYSLFADFVHVITTDSHIKGITKKIPEQTGIICLTERGTFKKIRPAISNKKNCSPETIFNSLRKDEYCQVIKSFFGYIPDVPNTLIHKACLELFKEIPNSLCHDLMIKAVKSTRTSNHQKRLIENAPKSLKAATVSANLTKKQSIQLKESLDSMLGTI